MVAASRLGGLIWRRLGFSQSEKLTIYIMSSLAACISGLQMVPFLLNTMVAGRYYASDENGWDRLSDLLPRWFAPTDARVIRDYYEGSGSLYRVETLAEWAGPLAFWSAMMALMVIGAVCLSNVFGSQWINRERLTFPLAQLPLRMTEEGPHATFWRNRLMWGGFALAGLLESVNFVNYLFPSVPTVWLKARRWDAWAMARPWNAVRPLSLAFYPFMIGIGFLLTQEVAFSCWFFYLLGKLECIITEAAGIRGGAAGSGFARLPLIHEQGTGAMLGLIAGAVWVARRQLREAWRQNRIDSTGFLTPRAALLGLAVSVLALTTMASVAGVPAIIALVLFVLYFVVMMAISRVVAEAGAGWTMLGSAQSPHGLIIAALGTRGWNPRSLASFAFMDWMDSDYRDAVPVQLLTGLKFQTEAGVPRRQMLWSVVVATGVGLVSSLWVHLHIYYTYGAATAKVRSWYTSVGTIAYRKLAGWTNYPTDRDWWGLGGYAAGALTVMGLGFARQQMPTLALHPVGYAIANTPSMDYLWMPFLIAWALKAVILRYSGIKTYRMLVPFALGGVLGDFAIPALWGLYGTLISKQMYLFFPH